MNYTCLSVGENPNYGYTNFDNFAWSLVTAFQLITMDFWENVFNYVSINLSPVLEDALSFFTFTYSFLTKYLLYHHLSSSRSVEHKAAYLLYM